MLSQSITQHSPSFGCSYAIYEFHRCTETVILRTFALHSFDCMSKLLYHVPLRSFDLKWLFNFALYEYTVVMNLFKKEVQIFYC